MPEMTNRQLWSRKGGRGLASIEHGVDTPFRQHVDYIKKEFKKRLITAIRNNTNIRNINRTIITRKQKWKEKQLNRHFKQSSSSCHAAGTDIPDPLLPLLPIVHRLW